MTTAPVWRRLALGLLPLCVLSDLDGRTSAVVVRQDHHFQKNSPPLGPWAQWWAFSAPWDPRSTASIKAHGQELGAVVTGWVALDTISLQPTPLYRDSTPSSIQRFTLLTNYFRDRFRPETVRRLAANATALSHATDSLTSIVTAAGYKGVVIDFEGMLPADTTALTIVIHALATALHARGISPVAMTVVAADSVAYPARRLIAAGADRLILMVYDEHWSTSPPGPIVSPAWADTLIGSRVAEARGAAHLVVAVPVYGYQWRRKASTVVVGADDARRLAASWHTTLTRDPVSLNLTARGPDSSVLWVADGTTADTVTAIARRLGINTFALWRLGLTDSTFWLKR
jgi:spore germination protein YaaH